MLHTVECVAVQHGEAQLGGTDARILRTQKASSCVVNETLHAEQDNKAPNDSLKGTNVLPEPREPFSQLLIP